MADPWNPMGSGRMRRDQEIPSRSGPQSKRGSASWNYPNANEYDELGVQELLHGLEAESSLATPLPRPPVPAPADGMDSGPEEVCHSCKRKNPAGQRFCGYCGTKRVQAGPAQPESVPSGRARTGLAQPEAEEPPVREKAREAWPFTPAARSGLNVRVADVTHESWRGNDRLDEPFVPGDSPEEREHELQFLRNMANDSSEEGSSSRGWKVLLILLLFAGGGYAGYHWLYAPPAAPPAMYKAEPAEPPAADEQNAAPASQPSASPQPQSKPEASTQSGDNHAGSEAKAPVSQRAGETAAQPEPASEPAPGTPTHVAVPSGAGETPQQSAPETSPAHAVVPPASIDGGQQELATAERYLYGGGGEQNSGEAAKWLWLAVGKQNGRAILLLSDLYAKGEGVPRNCDQARLLLMTAVRKKVPDAGLELRRIESSGCQ